MPWPSLRLTRTVSRPSWSTMTRVVGVHAVEVGDERVDVDERMPRVCAGATSRRRERAVDLRRDRARPLEVGGVVDLDRVVGMHRLDADAAEEPVSGREEPLGAQHVERAGLGVLGLAVLPARAVRGVVVHAGRAGHGVVAPEEDVRWARPRTRRRVRPTSDPLDRGVEVGGVDERRRRLDEHHEVVGAGRVEPERVERVQQRGLARRGGAGELGGTRDDLGARVARGLGDRVVVGR